ncbi:hypothetical protein [Streptomyces sp. PH10-H1]|uniref:hypothetical protein n=1 Tax=Streptomyces sp. PH10-H1 TaxID=3046212 RepID=UPI0024B8CD59|nr:hypothetical protein [Streptomyces sp. PH10-H1]
MPSRRHVGGEERVVVVGQDVDQLGGEVGVGCAVRNTGRAAGAQPAGRLGRRVPNLTGQNI